MGTSFTMSRCFTLYVLSNSFSGSRNPSVFSCKISASFARNIAVWYFDSWAFRFARSFLSLMPRTVYYQSRRRPLAWVYLTGYLFASAILFIGLSLPPNQCCIWSCRCQIHPGAFDWNCSIEVLSLGAFAFWVVKLHCRHILWWKKYNSKASACVEGHRVLVQVMNVQARDPALKTQQAELF